MGERRRRFQLCVDLFNLNHWQELATVMKSLGLQATQLELTQMMTEADEDGSGSIEFDEFLNMMKRKMKENENSIEDVKAAFKVFDQNGDG